MRILITGSRDWRDDGLIHEVLGRLTHKNKAEEHTLVSGNCPTGADSIAEEWWDIDDMGTLELHPADWEQYGKRAGFIRNSEMVKLGADICIAFIQNNSRGATMTADLAEKAGIKTVRFIRNYPLDEL